MAPSNILIALTSFQLMIEISAWAAAVISVTERVGQAADPSRHGRRNKWYPFTGVTAAMYQAPPVLRDSSVLPVA